MLRRVVVLLIALVVLGGCKVDATVELTIEGDGTGDVRLTLVADSELVGQAPGLAEELRLDDLRSAGWVITGPDPTPSGGLQLVLVHPFATVEEAEALLASINGPGGPLIGMTVTRTATPTRTDMVLAGTLRVTDGINAFADAPMLEALGGTSPYASEMEAAGVTVSDVVVVDVVAHLPGKVDAGTADESGGTVRWEVPLDGTATVVQVSSVQTASDGKWWRWGATAALVVFVGWIAFATLFILYVTIARRRRGLHRLRHLRR